jgi:hypothetical protein
LQREPTFSYIKSTVAIFAVTGLLMGILGLISGSIDDGVIEASSSGGGGFGQAIGGAIAGSAGAGIPISGVAFMGMLIAVGSGVRFAANVNEDLNTTAIAVAAASFVGLVAMWILSAFLAVAGIDGISVNFGGLIINAIIGGLAVAGLAAATVWIERNLTPGPA